MKQFMDENFLLETQTAQDLFHNHAAKMPIIDYHCHLIPEMVANDHQFKSITELWLGGDHYKWRAMRTNGVDERFCTGTDTSDWEKFEKWAETVPYTFRNPLYHWTHLELKTAFGINKLLSPKTAREIFDECNEKLKQPEYTARGFMRKYHVETVCTTDDPIDDLRYHKQTKESGFEIKMIPAWRPDKAMNIEKPEYASYVNQLAEVSGVIASLIMVLKNSMMSLTLIVRLKRFLKKQCVDRLCLNTKFASTSIVSFVYAQKWIMNLAGLSNITTEPSVTTTH